MKSTIRILLTLGFFGGILALLVWAFWPKPILVDLARVERGKLLVTVDEDGKTNIRERYTVSAPLSGRLERIELEAGDPVKEGETLLAVIESRDSELLDPRTVKEAEANVEAKKLAVEQVDTEIAKARENQAFAEKELARISKLRDTNAKTQKDHEQATLNERNASNDLRAAQLSREIALYNLEQAKAGLLQAQPEGTNGAERDPNRWNFEIRAPIDGRVLNIFQESAVVVTTGAALLEIGNPADLEIVIDLLSEDSVKVQEGARVILEHWGGDHDLSGRVRRVEPKAYTKISTLGVEEQRVNVVVDLLDPFESRSTLGHGFRVEARIVVWEGENIKKISTSALFRRGDQDVVYKIVDGKATETAVTLGHMNGLEAEVLSGLEEGDQIIIHPSDSVKNGTTVEERNAVVAE